MSAFFLPRKGIFMRFYTFLILMISNAVFANQGSLEKKISKSVWFKIGPQITTPYQEMIGFLGTGLRFKQGSLGADLDLTLVQNDFSSIKGSPLFYHTLKNETSVYFGPGLGLNLDYGSIFPNLCVGYEFQAIEDLFQAIQMDICYFSKPQKQYDDPACQRGLVFSVGYMIGF